MRRGLAALAFIALCGACSYVDRDTGVYRPPGITAIRTPHTGEQLFLRDCAWCHGNTGLGTSRGPDLNGELDGGAYTDFMLTTGRMPIDSQDEAADRKDPAYTADEIRGIVEYVSGLGGTGPGVPAPAAEEGDLTRGGELYQENCAACHSSTGVGGALTSGRLAPSLAKSTPIQIAEAMLVGPGCPSDSPTCGAGEGAMPTFEFSEADTNSIIRYIVYLQGGPDEGGHDLGRIGPVTEGAAAWIVGLGLLLVVARWIGTKVEP